MPLDSLHRSASGCLCCGSEKLKRETTIVSPFLAKRAWNGAPELTSIVFCLNCDFRFYERGLSNEEAERYYRTYRDQSYYRERHGFEPFYTRREHERLEEWMSSGHRRVALRECLNRAGAPAKFHSALDFGGGTGKMLLDIAADERAVFDVVDEAPERGLTRLHSAQELGKRWDLVLSCQTLEHLTDPLASIGTMADAMPEGGWLYAEVPPQHWRNPARQGRARDAFLGWLVHHHHLLLAGDILSTALRIQCGFLPPLGFIPMREHLNYFTEASLSRLLLRGGFSVEWAGRNSEDCITVVGKRSAARPKEFAA